MLINAIINQLDNHSYFLTFNNCGVVGLDTNLKNNKVKVSLSPESSKKSKWPLEVVKSSPHRQ